jgi:proteasome lid subunit RPN8/RPN11
MAKLQFIRDIGPTEISGFGIAAPDDLLLVEDFQMIKQTNTTTHTEFDDDDFGRYLEEWTKAGYELDQIARIWIHTHPVGVNGPSGTDETTFQDKFGTYPFSVMYILTRANIQYCRLQFNHKSALRQSTVIAADVDFTQPFPRSNKKVWQKEYDEYCEEEVWPTHGYGYGQGYMDYRQDRRTPYQRRGLKQELQDDIQSVLDESKRIREANKLLTSKRPKPQKPTPILTRDPIDYNVDQEEPDALIDQDDIDLLAELDGEISTIDIASVIMGYEETQDVLLDDHDMVLG